MNLSADDLFDGVFDADGYPSEKALATLRSWDCRDFDGAIAFMRRLWKYDNYIWDDVDEDGDPVICVSTGGWSGNESLIYALEENRMWWALWWWQSRSGGHYQFKPRGWGGSKR